MARATYRKCHFCGDFHDVANWPSNHVDAAPARSDFPSPCVNSDQMDDTWHPHNGQYYDSKSSFRAVTKQSGGEEVGNEVQKDQRKNDLATKDDVAKAYNMVSQGYKPGVSESAKDGWS